MLTYNALEVTSQKLLTLKNKIMFKFIKQYAEKIEHAQIYPMISLLIFFLFFVMLLIIVKNMRKDRIAELSNIPLDNEELTNSPL